MYKTNGIELSSNEFKELLLLVNARSGGKNVQEFAESRLIAPNDEGLYSTRYNAYKMLCDKGLFLGDADKIISEHCFVFLPSDSGIDFVCDIMLQKADDDAMRKDQKEHDYKVALFSLLGGAISGGAITVLLNFAFNL